MPPRLWAGSVLVAICAAVPAATPAAAQEPVRIVNTPVPTRQADLPALQPVQRTGRVPAGRHSGLAYTVPPRKRLVIEYVEGDVGWQTTVGGVTVNYFPAGVTSSEGRLVRIYADAGTHVYAVRRASSRIGFQSQGNFSGYLVDVP